MRQFVAKKRKMVDYTLILGKLMLTRNILTLYCTYHMQCEATVKAGIITDNRYIFA